MDRVKVDEDNSFTPQDISESIEQIENEDQQVPPVNPHESTLEDSNEDRNVASPQTSSPVGNDVPGSGTTHVVRGRLTVRPDKYDGTGDWEEFLVHFITCAKLGK